MNQRLLTEDAIQYALLDLEKASVLLNNWTQEYSYSQRPTISILTAPEQETNKDLKLNAYKWIYEYDTIKTIIDIVFDYVIKSQKTLREVKGEMNAKE